MREYSEGGEETYQGLKLVCAKFVLIVDYGVVSGPAGPLDTTM